MHDPFIWDQIGTRLNRARVFWCKHMNGFIVSKYDVYDRDQTESQMGDSALCPTPNKEQEIRRKSHILFLPDIICIYNPDVYAK